MALDDTWKDWNKTKSGEDFDRLMEEASPVIDKAITTYAKFQHPALKSKARVLASRAIKSFDPAKGTKLQTHLFNQLQPLSREMSSYTTVHVPERVTFDKGKLHQIHNNFVEKYGREPNEDELADYSGLSRKRIQHVRTYDRAVLGESSFGSDSESDNPLPATEKAKNLWTDFVYHDLPEQDKLIYDLRTGRGGTEKELGISEIARKIKVSASAVSQRLAKISDKMSEGMKYE